MLFGALIRWYVRISRPCGQEIECMFGPDLQPKVMGLTPWNFSFNSITDDIFLSNHDKQYIITSHHPYIINNISPEYWKIVTRKGSIITVHDAKDFHISPTRQKAFIELINVLEDFPEGLESAWIFIF